MSAYGGDLKHLHTNIPIIRSARVVSSARPRYIIQTQQYQQSQTQQQQQQPISIGEHKHITHISSSSSSSSSSTRSRPRIRIKTRSRYTDSSSESSCSRSRSRSCSRSPKRKPWMCPGTCQLVPCSTTCHLHHSLLSTQHRRCEYINTSSGPQTVCEMTHARPAYFAYCEAYPPWDRRSLPRVLQFAQEPCYQSHVAIVPPVSTGYCVGIPAIQPIYDRPNTLLVQPTCHL